MVVDVEQKAMCVLSRRYAAIYPHRCNSVALLWSEICLRRLVDRKGYGRAELPFVQAGVEVAWIFGEALAPNSDKLRAKPLIMQLDFMDGSPTMDDIGVVQEEFSEPL